MLKSTVILALSVAFAVAQSTVPSSEGLPPCALTCAVQEATEHCGGSAGITNVTCQCSNEAYRADFTTCVQTSCASCDLVNATNVFGRAACGSVGITISTSIPCTSGGSPNGTAPNNTMPGTPTGPSGLPMCGARCVQSALNGTACTSAANLTCTCTNPDYAANLVDCLRDNCNATDANAATSLGQSQCASLIPGNAPNTTQQNPTSTTPSAGASKTELGGIAFAMVLLVAGGFCIGI